MGNTEAAVGHSIVEGGKFRASMANSSDWSPRKKTRPACKSPLFGGEGEIRTHEPLAGLPVFKTHQLRARDTLLHAFARITRVWFEALLP